jgi:hypothetical protein
VLSDKYTCKQEVCASDNGLPVGGLDVSVRDILFPKMSAVFVNDKGLVLDEGV